MRIEDILKNALIGKKLLRKVFDNTTIVGVEDIHGWENESEFMYDSGVTMMLRIERPFKTTIRKRTVRVDLDDNLVLG